MVLWQYACMGPQPFGHSRVEYHFAAPTHVMRPPSRVRESVSHAGHALCKPQCIMYGQGWGGEGMLP